MSSISVSVRTSRLSKCVVNHPERCTGIRELRSAIHRP
jgi:hypothetical protein